MRSKELDQTLVLVKPDAMKNSLTGYVLSQLSEFHTGLIFAAAKVVRVTRMLAEEHYLEHRGKVFYPSLIEYLQGHLHYPDAPHRQRVIALVYQGPEAVEKVRAVAGPTNPHSARDQKPGCVRSLGTVVPLKNEEGVEIGERMDNLIHASASYDEAEREIKLWFQPSDIPPNMRGYATKWSEEHFYFKGGSLFARHEPGSVCLLAPGDVIWESDLEALHALHRGTEAKCSLEAVVSKYLVNRKVAFDW